RKPGPLDGVRTMAAPAFAGGIASEFPPDQFLHDLVGAAKDARHARRAPGPGDRIFIHVSRPAEELETLVHHFPLKVGVPQLRRGALFGGKFLLHVARERPVEMRPADLQLRLEICEDEAAVLEIEDRLAERLALARIL